MLDFKRLMPGDKVHYYGSGDYTVASVDTSGDWWMVEFTNGDTIKSLDPAHILGNFSAYCSTCKNERVRQVGDECSECKDKANHPTYLEVMAGDICTISIRGCLVYRGSLEWQVRGAFGWVDFGIRNIELVDKGISTASIVLKELK